MPTKLQVLKSLNLGQRVAEEEADELQKYFVRTAQWEELAAGQIDIVYGPKGSGKSALYTSLLQQTSAFHKRKILVASAENPRGATVFKSIVDDPPPTEVEFTSLWKLYILVITAKIIRQKCPELPEAKALVKTLESARLLPAGDNLASYFQRAADYVKAMMDREAASIQHEIAVDPVTGMPIFKRKVHFSKKPKDKTLNDLRFDDLLSVSNNVLKAKGLTLWIAFDRLDVAFVGSPDLERNALRALFRAYSDLKAQSQIRLKIFVRDDVWQRIAEGGFTEASHITKSLHIAWSEENLLNLVVLRLIASSQLRRCYNVKISDLKESYENQVELFYRIFPDKVATGKNPSTMGWFVTRTSDGSGVGKPREIIHLVDVARRQQIVALERGGKEPPQEQLIDRASIKGALPLVSKVYFEQTLLAEHDDLKKWKELLVGEKATQNLKSLTNIWNLTHDEAQDVVKRLVDIGFFEKRGGQDSDLRIPFLLRPALKIVQGKAAG